MRSVPVGRRKTATVPQKGRAEIPGPKTVGYARVSSGDQDAALQIDALTAAGVKPADLYTDEGWSGTRGDRPALEAAFAALAPGDTLAVWKLDRLGRSLLHLVGLAETLRERGVRFRSLTEAIDTSTASGRLLYAVLGAVAAFERDVLIERTRAGHDGGEKARRSRRAADHARRRAARRCDEHARRGPVEA